MEELAKGLVEAADAAKAGGKSDLRHRQTRVMDQLFGEQHAAGLRHRDRRRTEMLHEESAQLSSADAEPLGQFFDARIIAIERTLGDQGEAARHRVRGAAPGAELRRGLRPATQAGTETRLLCRRRRRVETAILELGGARWADRPTIDPGRGHTDEEAAVETRIACLKCPVAGLWVELFHGATMPPIRCRRSRFSDTIGGDRKSPARAGLFRRMTERLRPSWRPFFPTCNYRTAAPGRGTRDAPRRGRPSTARKPS